MSNVSQEISINIINEITKSISYLDVDIKLQNELRNKIEEQLNDYDIASKCTDLAACDILDKAFIFLACKKLEGLSPSTRGAYVSLFKRMDKYFNRPIATITTMDLRLFLANVYKDNQANSTNNKISCLKTFFSWLQDEGYLIQNPSKNLALIKTPYRRRGHIESLDIERIRNGCKTTRDKAMFEFFLSTGCRVSEAANALITNINWAENSIILIGKGDKERKIFFSSRTKLFLMNYIEERQNSGIQNNYLFVGVKSPHENLTSRTIERSFLKLARQAGVSEKITPHWYRHSYATIAISQGVQVETLSQLLGHSNLSVTQKYYDLDDSHLKHEYGKIAM